MTLQRRTLFLAGLSSSIATAMAASAARADTFPSKPIRLIVPFAAGGNADVTARLISDGLSRRFNQPVVVDNRPGAGGVVGQEIALQSPADGYTMVISVFSSLSTVPMIVVVPAGSRFADWKAMLAEAKAKPGTVSVGHAGNGTPNHIDILRLQENEKVRFSVVPYRGSGVGLNDVLASQIDSFVDQLSSSLPHIQSGKLKPLVVLGEKRVPELPNVPTLAETGCTPFDGGTTLGLFVRAGTPSPVVAALNTATVAALEEPTIKQRFVELGATVRPSTPEGFAAFLKIEDESVSDLAKKGLLKAE